MDTTGWHCSATGVAALAVSLPISGSGSGKPLRKLQLAAAVTSIVASSATFNDVRTYASWHDLRAEVVFALRLVDAARDNLGGLVLKVL
jgi:hypothetical protein